MRRRMREAADWTWLAACMGVVEGDMNPVEAYLNGGGDPTRKLTNPEVGSHFLPQISLKSLASVQLIHRPTRTKISCTTI